MKIIPIIADLPISPTKAQTALGIVSYYLRALGSNGQGKIIDIICRPLYGQDASVNVFPVCFDGQTQVDKFEANLTFPTDNDLHACWWSTLKIYGQERVSFIVTIDEEN